jgi:hypothetical protein
VLAADNSIYARTLIRAIENSGYFHVVREVTSESEAERALARGSVQFAVTIPESFARKLARGERPVLLVEADASDPAATSNALAALLALNQTALTRDLQGVLGDLQSQAPPFELRVQRRYNPEGITQYNVVPGLIGVVLTMTMVMMTSLAVTREYERGTMENLLATPLRPIEVMVGKSFLHYRRLRAGHRYSDRGETPVRSADTRQRSVAVAVADTVHRRQSRDRLHVFDACEESDAGDADDVLFLSAVDAAVGFHIPVPRHAGVGAMAGRSLSAHAFPAHRAR